MGELKRNEKKILLLEVYLPIVHSRIGDLSVKSQGWVEKWECNCKNKIVLEENDAPIFYNINSNWNLNKHFNYFLKEYLEVRAPNIA